MKKLITLTCLTTGIIALSAFSGKREKPVQPVSAVNKAIEISNFNINIKPGDDFYEYVNGTWIKNNPIPGAETRWGSFNILDDVTRTRVKVILDDNAKNTTAAKGSAEQKIRDFYATGMDSLKLEKQGSAPIMPMLEKVKAIKDKNELMTAVANMHKMGISAFFGFYVGQDDKNSTQMIINLFQGGLGLPDKDYYLKDDDESKNIREKYVALMSTMFKMVGEGNGAERANAILKMESDMAANSRSRVELRNPEANYNKMSNDQLLALMPSVNYKMYEEAIGAPFGEVIVGQPKFFEGLDKIISVYSLDDLKSYLMWNIINERAPMLSSAFEKADFDFYQGTLSGAKEMKPRWKRVMGTMNGTVGELIGQIYVKKYFTAEAKMKVDKMVQNLIAAYKERISSRTWMAEETKKAAMAKLEKVTRKLAYPDKWRDYTKLDVGTESYCDNVNKASQFFFDYNISKLGKPIDKTVWGMTPQTINAYYNPGFNEIVFPAAIMQPPFFDPLADDAVNYGGMGAVIGHELTHGFDDQGSQYDAEGNLKQWWLEEDKKRFESNTAKLIKQYNEFNPLDSLTVNGQLTLGENIADLGGLTIAYAALQKDLAGKPKPKIDGFSPEQRFFISYAQVWRNNIRNEELKRRLKVDVHSPGKYRTLGPLRNMPEFYAAFNIKPTDKMYLAPTDRAEIW
jgi:putative endopeptidase